MTDASRADRRCIGIVLAGGQSRRMGRNKALLEYRATTLLQHQVALLRRFCEHVVVSGAYPDYDCVHDIRPGMGPLSGMHAAAKRFDGDTLLFFFFDMPAMTSTVLKILRDHGGPCHFETQPMPCVFPAESGLVDAIESLWRSGDDGHAVNALHRALVSQSLEFSGTAEFENINTPLHWDSFTSAIESL